MKEKFFGAWKIQSFEYRLPDGTEIFPFGKKMNGLLLYDPTGAMSANLMKPGIPKCVSENPFEATMEEAKAAFLGYPSYYGTFEVNEKDMLITHHIEGSIFPNFIGEKQIRKFEFSENRLTLSAALSFSKEKMQGTLVWEKIPL